MLMQEKLQKKKTNFLIFYSKKKRKFRDFCNKIERKLKKKEVNIQN